MNKMNTLIDKQLRRQAGHWLKELREAQGFSQRQLAAEFPTDQARQGVTGHNVRYVLGLGVAGAVIGFVVIGFLAAHDCLGTLW